MPQEGTAGSLTEQVSAAGREIPEVLREQVRNAVTHMLQVQKTTQKRETRTSTALHQEVIQ